MLYNNFINIILLWIGTVTSLQLHALVYYTLSHPRKTVDPDYNLSCVISAVWGLTLPLEEISMQELKYVLFMSTKHTELMSLKFPVS